MLFSNKLFVTILCFILAINLFCQSKQYDYTNYIEETISSEILNEEIVYMVSIPEEYNTHTYIKYPVLVVLDAGDHFAGMQTILNYYWGNFLPKMIIVGIKSNQNRTEHFTSFLENKVNSKSAGFTRFMDKELLPLIHHNYPTLAHNTLVGHSHAGLYALHRALSDDKVFSNYCIIDPSLYLISDEQKKSYFHPNNLSNLANKSIYIGMGGPLDRDNNSITIEEVLATNSASASFSRPILQLCNVLQNSSISKFSFNWKYYPDDIHGTVPLPTSIDGLKHFYSWYQLTSAPIINNPESSLEAVKDAIAKRREKININFGKSLPIADEELFSFGGQMFVQYGQNEKAELFYITWIENYPHSPNAYLEFADFYIHNNKKEEAISLLKKASQVIQDITISEKLATLIKG